MKILITFLLVAFSSVAFGKEICTEVPEGTKFDDVKVNFDGSKIAALSQIEKANVVLIRKGQGAV